jgi:hypothetical protein
MANINDLGRLIANAVKAGLQEVGSSTGSGAVVSSSHTVMPKPTFTNLAQGPGGPNPPYGAGNVINPPFANSGSAGGQPSFSGMALTGLGATVSAMPGAQAANFVNYANTRLAGMFPSGAQGQFPRMPGDDLTGRYNAASQYVRQLSQRATITNPLDVYAGLSQLSYQKNFGIMGDAKADPFLQGSAAMSNIVPGAGFEKTSMSLFNAFMDPTRQNRAMMLGLSVTDPTTGRPKDPRTIADQIWNRINSQKLGGSPITKDDIQRALLPGRSLHSMLNQLIGDDPLARNIIAQMLVAKAMTGGQSAYSLATKEKLTELGFTTEGMTSASARAAGELGGIQSVARAETYGLTKANESANMLAESLSRLNNLLGFATPGAAIAGFLDSIGGKLFGGGKAAGGATKSSNAYLVGEMGPELFVPKTDGYVVPNHELRFAGARHDGGFVHPHPHPSWSSKDLDDKGRMSSAKVKELLAHVGFQGSSIGNAMSIIGAESARRAGAQGDVSLQDEKWGPSVGLFQIRSLKNPSKYNDPMRNANLLDDPLFNVMAGYEKSKGGTDWGGWSTAKGLGLDSGGSGGSSINTVSASEPSSGGFFSRMAAFMPSLFRNMSGMASGNVVNYGGVKVEVILPGNAKVDGKSLAKEIQKALEENNLQNKAKVS